MVSVNIRIKIPIAPCSGWWHWRIIGAQVLIRLSGIPCGQSEHGVVVRVPERQSRPRRRENLSSAITICVVASLVIAPRDDHIYDLLSVWAHPDVPHVEEFMHYYVRAGTVGIEIDISSITAFRRNSFREL
jgi:hypothetical protein